MYTLIKVLSLFSGIGAFEKALEREEIPHEVVAYCEIDKFASKSYSTIHNIPESLNLGDISKVDTSDITECDLVTYGFPCQDISVAGLQRGIKAGETRSGLLYEALRIIEAKKPKYAIAENVKNLVGKRFRGDFEQLLALLNDMGYNSYWQVLNAKNYGIPQNRERVFIISIRKDIDNGTFKFPEKLPLELKLKDMLEETVDEKFYLTPKQVDNFQSSNFTQRKLLLQKDVCGTPLARDYKEPKCIGSWPSEKGEGGTKHQSNKVQEILVNNPVPKLVGGIGEINFGKQYRQGNRVYDANEIAMCLNASPVGNTGGYSYLYKVIITDQQIIDSIPNTYNKKRAQELLNEKGYLPEFHVPYNSSEVKETSPTLTTSSGSFAGCGSVMYKHDFRIRKLTPKECWRLMGFDDSDFDKAKSAGISNTQLYKQAGNSIVVDVLQYIFRSLFNKGGK